MAFDSFLAESKETENKLSSLEDEKKKKQEKLRKSIKEVRTEAVKAILTSGLLKGEWGVVMHESYGDHWSGYGSFFLEMSRKASPQLHSLFGYGNLFSPYDGCEIDFGDGVHAHLYVNGDNNRFRLVHFSDRFEAQATLADFLQKVEENGIVVSLEALKQAIEMSKRSLRRLEEHFTKWSHPEPIS
jgi:hypothetical protein